jgi:hypothetical protein
VLREAARKLTVAAHFVQAVQEHDVDPHAQAQDEEPQVYGILSTEDCHGLSVAHLNERPKISGDS